MSQFSSTITKCLRWSTYKEKLHFWLLVFEIPGHDLEALLLPAHAQHDIMMEACIRGKPLTSWPQSKKGKKTAQSDNPLQEHCLQSPTDLPHLYGPQIPKTPPPLNGTTWAKYFTTCTFRDQPRYKLELSPNSNPNLQVSVSTQLSPPQPYPSPDDLVRL